MKNLHLEHPEDILLDGDYYLAFAMLEKVFHVCLGQAGANISEKWDGAPAFVSGLYPGTNRFFVGTKSAFSGKVAFSESEIYMLTDSPGLQEKLKWLYRTLAPVVTGNVVIQGDMLWWPGHPNHDIVTNTVSIQPNTLKYTFNGSTPFGHMALTREVGVVIHTIYRGNRLADLEAEVNTQRFEQTNHLAIIDPTIGTTGPLLDESTQNDLWHDLISLTNHITTLNGLTSLKVLQNGRLNTLARQFINYCYRNAIHFTGNAFIDYIVAEYVKEANRLKTTKGKTRKLAEGHDLIAQLHRDELDVLFTYITKYTEFKLRLIDILEKNFGLQGSRGYISLPDGTLTGHEGYVVQLITRGTYFKLVDRGTFSRANMLYTGKDWVGK